MHPPHRRRVAYRNTPHGRSAAILNAAKRRAVKAQRPFLLTRDWVCARIAAGYCEATGLAFDLTPAMTRRFTRPLAPSIDRIDPSQGYTPANCRVVIYAYNVARGRWGDDVLILLVEGLAKTLRRGSA